MVFHYDETKDPSIIHSDHMVAQLVAHPRDRLKAFLFDFVILFLLNTLFLSFHIKKIRIEMFLDNTDKALLLLVEIFIINALIIISYQTFFVWLKGKTPGKFFIKLKVSPLWANHKISFKDSFVRGFFWYLNIFMFFIPGFSILSNKKHRTFYDKISDTIVVTERKVSSYIPQKFDGILYNAMWVCMLLLFFQVGFQTYLSLTQVDENHWLSELANLTPQGCSQIVKNQEEWPLELGKKSTRLSVAMALYASGTIGESCLNEEAHRAFILKEEVDLAYLTKAFSSKDDQELSDKYLKKVCEINPDSRNCIFTKVIDDWTQEKWDVATVGFNKLFKDARVFEKVWGILHFERTKDFERELLVITSIADISSLNVFLATHKAISLWGVNKINEATEIAKFILPNLSSSEERINLSSFFCYRELISSCENAKSNLCTQFSKDIDASDIKYYDSRAFVTYLRHEECSENKIDFNALESKMNDESFKMYVQGVQAIHENDKEGIKVIFKWLGRNKSDNKNFEWDSQLRLIENAKSVNELTDIHNIWKDSEVKSWSYLSVGKKLALKMLDLKNYKLSSQILTQLENKYELDQELKKELVVRYYNSGFKKEAWNIFHRSQDRRPAKIDEFEVIIKKLSKEFQK